MIKKLLIICVVSIVTLTGCKNEKTTINKGSIIPTTTKNISENKNEAYKTTAYYFHSDVRCMSCVKIERYIKEVYEQHFTDKLDFKIVNTDKLENKHYIEDYQLYTKSLVLVKTKNGINIKHKNLDKIWIYLENEEKFKTYIKDGIEQFLSK